MTTLDDIIGRSEHKSAANRITSVPVFWVILAAIAACVALTLLTDTFATQRNVFNVMRNFTFVAIIAIGMTVVIASGGIDLSVGSTVVLTAMVLSVLMTAGWSFLAAAFVALLAALAVGAFNGVLIAYAGMPPFVVTLGTLSGARSLAMVLSNNQMIYEFGPDQSLLLWLGGGSSLGIPHPTYVLAALMVVMALILRWTRWGQYVFAIGGNEQAAILNGISVKFQKVTIYMFAAFTAGLTGILMTGWLGSVTTNLGQSMELAVIAAAVIGGANLAGGEGTAVGAVVGAFLIEVIRNSLILLGISTFWQGMFIGTFIIVAVAFDRFRNRRNA
ncbi:ABC transporter permease [Pararhodobacter zhoushanensis]|uniref:ABC transporter permease n=1 Tax=Pararhodobacter zhoushanensis TaxID=2479545 RepID=A0ABT3GWS5_9RHOB|nr:ABC transporter permease [Pararhodobacter zhoushanensis]MCW1931972.1 ABC transporter permease [Pararhodobacter zhoushanensis]